MSKYIFVIYIATYNNGIPENNPRKILEFILSESFD